MDNHSIGKCGGHYIVGGAQKSSSDLCSNIHNIHNRYNATRVSLIFLKDKEAEIEIRVSGERAHFQSK